MDANDTHPSIEELQLAGYRRMSSAQLLAIVSQLTAAVHQLALLDIRRRHPQADEREQRLRLVSRFTDASTMRRVFGWDPDVYGLLMLRSSLRRDWARRSMRCACRLQ
jgi:hypothetical protein